MDTLLERYKKLADEAGVNDSATLKAQERYRRLVNQELPVTNIDRLGKNLQQIQRLSSGMLVFFEYDAKTADTLPYWDRHPLVLINKITTDGWIGVNLHYIHPQTRARMLYNRKKGGSLTDVSDDLVSRATKRYLAKQVVVKPKLVPDDLYDTVIQIPFHNFAKASARRVWRDTSMASKKKKR